MKFYERFDFKGRVNGYTVERETDGVRGGMFHVAGRTWSAVFGGERFEGTRAKAADWVLAKVANAD